MIDLGTHADSTTGANKAIHKIMLCWEIHALESVPKMMGETSPAPMTVSKEYSLSWSSSSALRGDLEAWRGKSFNESELRRLDLKTILGARCLLRVTESVSPNDGVDGNKRNICPMQTTVKKSFPKLKSPLSYFNLSDPDWVIFERLDKSTQMRIKGTPNYRRKDSA